MRAATGSLDQVEIRGISCVVPDHPVLNESFLDRFGDGVDKFAKMAGVSCRYMAHPGQTTADLSYAATKQLFDSGRIERGEIDALVFVSQTPDYILPATACVLHQRLGLKKECVAFDVNLGCSGFVYGLLVAGSLCCNGGFRNVLLCGGDTISKLVSPLDRSVAMLFGDGGFAVLLSRTGAGNQSFKFLYGTDGSGHKNIIVPCGGQRNRRSSREVHVCADGAQRTGYELSMEGTEVFNFTISEVPVAINQLLELSGETPESVDMLILHQANLFIMKQIAKMTKFPLDKVPVSIDRYGNTSVASIPLTLCDALASLTDQAEKKVVLAGFGVGLSWGVVSLGIRPGCCLPVTRSGAGADEGAL